MANREQRGNKEKRKPKANKPKQPPQTSTFAGASNQPKSGKKGR
jgi:hypothetical protein